VRIRSLVMALLLISLFVPAAGALYIPGQEIPNDGLVHIMSAGDDTGATTAPVEMPEGISLPTLVQSLSGLSGLVPATGGPYSLFSQGSAGSALTGFPSQIGGSVSPAMPGASQGQFSIPAINLTRPNAEGNIVMDGVIGHIASPPTPGYWDNIQNMDLHTNMPVIGTPALFSL
jgi:hypothetical protein